MKRKAFWFAAGAVLALVLVLVLGGFAALKVYLGQIDRTYDEPTQTVAPEDEFFETDPDVSVVGPGASAQVPEQEPDDETSEVLEPEQVDNTFVESISDDHLINILLVGQDKYPFQTHQKRQRSDTMILCSVNPESGKVALISFLRDMYVQIPGGYSDNRLNVSYIFGGFELLNETLNKNFGVSVDANVAVDMAGFEAIVDLVGGVELELSEAEAEHMSFLYNGEEFRAGVNRLDGNRTRNFASLRAIDNDFGRTNRQRKVLLAIFDKVKALPAGELLKLMYEGLSYVTTDMTDGQILSLAYRLLPILPSVEIETYAVPARGTYRNANIRGMSVLVPDLQKIRDLLEREYLPLQ